MASSRTRAAKSDSVNWASKRSSGRSILKFTIMLGVGLSAIAEVLSNAGEGEEGKRPHDCSETRRGFRASLGRGDPCTQCKGRCGTSYPFELFCVDPERSEGYLAPVRMLRSTQPFVRLSRLVA